MNWGELVRDTIVAPADAAHRMLGWDIPRNVLYQAVFAVAAVNAVLMGISNMAFPSPIPLPAFMTQPLVFFLVVAGSIIILANLFYWAGRAMGGRGEMGDILTLITWLQGLRAAAQGVILMLSFLVPSVAALLAIAVSVYGLYIFLQFIRVGHGFPSLMQSIGLGIAVMTGLVLILMLLLTLSGVSIEGASPNV